MDKALEGRKIRFLQDCPIADKDEIVNLSNPIRAGGIVLDGLALDDYTHDFKVCQMFWTYLEKSGHVKNDVVTIMAGQEAIVGNVYYNGDCIVNLDNHLQITLGPCLVIGPTEDQELVSIELVGN